LGIKVIRPQIVSMRIKMVIW